MASHDLSGEKYNLVEKNGTVSIVYENRPSEPLREGDILTLGGNRTATFLGVDSIDPLKKAIVIAMSKRDFAGIELTDKGLVPMLNDEERRAAGLHLIKFSSPTISGAVSLRIVDAKDRSNNIALSLALTNRDKIITGIMDQVRAALGNDKALADLGFDADQIATFKANPPNVPGAVQGFNGKQGIAPQPVANYQRISDDPRTASGKSPFDSPASLPKNPLSIAGMQEQQRKEDDERALAFARAQQQSGYKPDPKEAPRTKADDTARWDYIESGNIMGYGNGIIDHAMYALGLSDAAKKAGKALLALDVVTAPEGQPAVLNGDDWAKMTPELREQAQKALNQPGGDAKISRFEILGALAALQREGAPLDLKQRDIGDVMKQLNMPPPPPVAPRER